MTEPKRSWQSALPEIIAKFGTTIKRKDLVDYCYQHNISRPHILRHHKTHRGVYDLKPLLDKGVWSVHQQHVTNQSATESTNPLPEKTEAEIIDEITARFETLNMMTEGIVSGDFRAMVVAGNPGIGKTYQLEEVLKKAADDGQILFTGIRGYVRATGLYKLLYDHRHEQGVVMFDDADSVFADEIGLNILKVALDTTKTREISWKSEKVLETEDGEPIPSTFTFKGAVIFISNKDFEREISSGNKLALHMEALMSRSYYMDLNMRSLRELVIYIKSVVAKTPILANVGVKKKEDHAHIIAFLEKYQNCVREMSLRTVIKLGRIWKNSKGDSAKFERMAKASLLRKVGENVL